MDTGFCIEALNEAIMVYGKPDIFSGDQGIRISMDGKERWMNNVFIERLWRSLKYECVYLNAFENGKQVRDKISV